MNKRPFSVTLIACLFLATGGILLVRHAGEVKLQDPFQGEALWICLIELAAVVGGAFVLLGKNWARWLLLVWMVGHIIISAFHSLRELATHVLIFGVIAYVLFRPQAAAYFRGSGAKCAPPPAIDEEPAA